MISEKKAVSHKASLKDQIKAEVIFRDHSGNLKCINAPKKKKKSIHYLIALWVGLKVGICGKLKLITNLLVAWAKPTNYNHHENTAFYTI